MIEFEESNYYQNLNSELQAYLKIVCPTFPNYLVPFIETATMQRLKDVGYFCGMDYASKNVFSFKYYLSCLDHSISCALMVWYATFNIKQTLAALFHDAASPACRHANDYRKGDHIKQEATESGLKELLLKDQRLVRLLIINNLTVDDICEAKAYPLVDNKRPQICADRLDGIYLSSLVWTQETTISEIAYLHAHVIVIKNEDGKEEFGFSDAYTRSRIKELNAIINDNTQTDANYYAMSLCGVIIDYVIKKGYIVEKDMQILTDSQFFEKITVLSLIDPKLGDLYQDFINLNNIQVPNRTKVKNRGYIKPLLLEKGCFTRE